MLSCEATRSDCNCSNRLTSIDQNTEFGFRGDQISPAVTAFMTYAIMTYDIMKYAITNLYLNSVTDWLVSARAVSMKPLKEPGLSGMVVASMASFKAPMSASSETKRSLSKFMFAPLVITTTVFSCKHSLHPQFLLPDYRLRCKLSRLTDWMA